MQRLNDYFNREQTEIIENKAINRVIELAEKDGAFLETVSRRYVEKLSLVDLLAVLGITDNDQAVAELGFEVFYDNFTIQVHLDQGILKSITGMPPGYRITYTHED